MPHAMLVAVIEEAVIELRPPLVPAEEPQTPGDLEPGEGPGDVGVGRVAMRQRVAHQEVRLRYDLVAEEARRGLAWHRLRQELEEALHDVVVLATKQGHEREHQHGVERWRSRLGGEHLLVAGAHPRLLSQWRSQVEKEAVDDSARGAAQPWVGLV